MKILVVVPISGLSKPQLEERAEYLRSIAREGTQVDCIQLVDAPEAIECPVDHAKASAEVIKAVEALDQDSFDAVIVWCGGDPGVEEARTILDIPVVGPGEAMRTLAQLLGRRVAGIHHPLPVLQLREDLEETLRLTEEAIRRKALEGYDTFYLDCLGMFGMGSKLRERTGFMVLDGGEASLRVAEMLVDLGVKANRVAYPKYPPPHRARRAK